MSKTETRCVLVTQAPAGTGEAPSNWMRSRPWTGFCFTWPMEAHVSQEGSTTQVQLVWAGCLAALGGPER